MESIMNCDYIHEYYGFVIFKSIHCCLIEKIFINTCLFAIIYGSTSHLAVNAKSKSLENENRNIMIKRYQPIY